MIRKLKKEEFALAVEIDKGLKNKWSPLWLEATVKTTLVLPKGRYRQPIVSGAGKGACRLKIADFLHHVSMVKLNMSVPK